ncbi:MAG TPA: hypothetical protein VLA52_14650 [Thermohalobaculum sp.]|nr:hypothetical protein [Thermohalobaculum sp.]
MTRGLAALAALAVLFAATPPAWACPPPSDEVLFHSCWGQARLAVALLPEDLPLPPAPQDGRRLAITGAYTATDTRADGLPKPVGLFVHGGQVINPNLGRMDGVLIVDPATGQPELHHRARLKHGGKSYDLTVLAERRAFLAAAAADGVSSLQSHLLIVDGRIDVKPQEAAPVFVRRLLFTDEEGFGIYQTPAAQTLREAAERIARRLGPRMALNLDMGSYDFCQAADGGRDVSCGFLGRDETAKLSNLLVLTLH